MLLLFNGDASAEIIDCKASCESKKKKVFDNEQLLCGCESVESGLGMTQSASAKKSNHWRQRHNCNPAFQADGRKKAQAYWQV